MSDDGTRWWDKAACAGHKDPDLFFPTTVSKKRMSESSELREAKIICRGCPVRIDCIQDALDTGEEYGVRGGELLNDERIRRKIGHRLR